MAVLIRLLRPVGNATMDTRGMARNAFLYRRALTTQQALLDAGI